jgi:hypothetical protein
VSGKNRDQRRKDKLAKRAKHERERQRDLVLPYDGKKYQAPEWAPHVSEVEIAVYEAIVQSGKRLTNDQTKEAFETLVRHLRDGHPARLPEGTPDVVLAPGTEVEFLVWNIRRRWAIALSKYGLVSSDDLIGILRTLLNSIVVHEWNTGPDLGYVAYIYKFLRDSPLV